MFFNSISQNYNKKIKLTKNANEDKKALESLYNELCNNVSELCNSEPVSEQSVKKVLDGYNKYLKKSGKKTQYKFYQVPEDKKVEYKANHDRAAEIVGRMNSCYYVVSSVLNSYLPHVSRQTLGIICMGVNDFNSAYDRAMKFATGTPEERKSLLEESIKNSFNLINDCVKNKSDKEYIDFIDKNLLTVFALSEYDGNKLDTVENELGFKLDPEIKARTSEISSFSNAICMQNSRIGMMANPNYTSIDSRNIPTLNEINENTRYVDNSAEFSQMFDEKYDNVKVGFQYATEYSNNDPENDLRQYLNAYKENHNNVTFKLEDGATETLNNEASYKKVLDAMLAGKSLIVENKGHVVGLVSKADNINNLDFKNDKLAFSLHDNTENVFKNLKDSINNLDSMFSRNHDEFKNLKNYVKNLDNIYSEKKSYKDVLNGFRDLAEKYVVADYNKSLGDKNERSNARFDFMLKAINSINEYTGFKPDLDIKPVRIPTELIEEENVENKDNIVLDDKENVIEKANDELVM